MDIDVVRLIEEVKPMEATMIRLIIDLIIALIMINIERGDPRHDCLDHEPSRLAGIFPP